MGFSKLTGIDTDTINAWGNEENKLSSSGSVIYKKLSNEREESLSAKLVSNKNPVAVLGVLNRNYQWNMPGVSRETSGKRVLSAEELPKLGGELHQNGAQLGLPEAKE